jgi:hypothetical protein
VEQDTIMATKQMIVAICLTAVVCLTEARSAIQETAHDPDTDLTTVRLFYFIPYDKLSERSQRSWRESSTRS